MATSRRRAPVRHLLLMSPPPLNESLPGKACHPLSIDHFLSISAIENEKNCQIILPQPDQDDAFDIARPQHTGY